MKREPIGPNTLLFGDCIEWLRKIPDNTFSACVSDPPYGLSEGSTKCLGDRLADILFDVVLPDTYHANVASGRLGEFSGPCDSVSLLDFMNGSIGEKTRVAVPESSIDFDGYIARQHEVKNCGKSSVLEVNGKLPLVGNSKPVEFCCDFVLNPRASANSSFRYHRGGLFRKFGLGRFGVPVVIEPNTNFSRFLCSLSPSGNTFLREAIRFCHDSECLAGSSTGVVTSSGAKLTAMLAFDARNGTMELLPASGAYKSDFVLLLVGAEPIRADSGTCRLPAVFEPRTFRFVGDATNRAITIHFHSKMLSEMEYNRKGFMGVDWDAEVPSEELWAEVLRVLKPGGHLLSFSGSRTYHRMTCGIEEAGFQIRDQIEYFCEMQGVHDWVQGQGFPKSLNIGKAIDKAAGVVRDVVGLESLTNDMRNGSLLKARRGEPQSSALL
jgi:hypothetical protein